MLRPRLRVSGLLLTSLLASICLVLSACGGSSSRSESGALQSRQQDAQGVPGDLQLPAPLDLLRQASTGPGDSARLRQASSYDMALPNNRVDSGGPKGPGLPGADLTFDPFWDAANPALADAAYCTYHFMGMSDYSGTPKLQLGWDTPPALGDFFLGVADFSTNRWRWFGASSLQQVGLPNFTDFTSVNGDVLVVVLVTGQAQVGLDWLVAGDTVLLSTTIGSDMDSDPALNLAPLTVQFSASTVIYGGGISDIIWDFNDDGTNDLTGDTSGTASFNYDQPGDYTCRVFVNSDNGGQVTDTLDFTVVNPANTPPIAMLQKDVSTGDAPLSVLLNASGSMDDDTIVRYEWDFDGDGVFEFDSGSDPSVQHIFGRSGATDVAVRVTDNDFASDIATDSITIFSGWHTAVISNNVPFVQQLAVCANGLAANSRACVAWQLYSSDDMFFARAQDLTGSAWTAPVAPVDNTDNVGHGLSMVAESQGSTPLIAYGRINSVAPFHTQYIVRAQNAGGSSWNAPLAIDAARDMGELSSLSLYAGKPILYTVENHQAGNNVLQCYQALDNLGSGWSAAFKVGDGPPDGNLVSLSGGAAGGGAFVAAGFNLSVINGFESFASVDAFATSWEAPVGLPAEHSSNVAFVMAEGRPAIAAGNSSQAGELLYVRSDDSAGKAWSSAPVQLAGPGIAGAPVMTTLAGVPAIAFVSFTGDDLWFMQAMDNFGAAWYPPYQVDSLASCSTRIGIAAVDSTIVIVYCDQDSDELRAAYFD